MIEHFISLCVGILAGVIASVAFWLLFTRFRTPKIEIEEGISRVFQDGKELCRIKISNKSRWRNVYSITTFYTFHFKGGFSHTVRGTFIPYLYKCKVVEENGRKVHNYEKLVEINPSEIRKKGVKLYKTLDEFFNDDGVVIEVIVLCNDKFDGAKAYCIQKLTQPCIVDGIFPPGEKCIKEKEYDSQFASHSDNNSD